MLRKRILLYIGTHKLPLAQPVQYYLKEHALSHTYQAVIEPNAQYGIYTRQTESHMYTYIYASRSNKTQPHHFSIEHFKYIAIYTLDNKLTRRAGRYSYMPNATNRKIRQLTVAAIYNLNDIIRSIQIYYMNRGTSSSSCTDTYKKMILQKKKIKKSK